MEIGQKVWETLYT